MTNNDIFKKLRVALMLRDDQIVEILELVDFRISKGEIGNFFRNETHEKYVECGDQILRNFLNGLVIYLRGTKDNPIDPKDVLTNLKKNITKKEIALDKTDFNKKAIIKPKTVTKKPKIQIIEKVRFNNGKNKKS